VPYHAAMMGVCQAVRGKREMPWIKF